MIHVIGLPRTGTSVIVKCLQNSGYFIGKKKRLGGYKDTLLSEYKPFKNVCRFIIVNHLNWLFKHRQCFPAHVLTATEQLLLKKRYLQAKQRGIEVLKLVIYLIPFIELYDRFADMIKNDVFIHTTRDRESNIQSLMAYRKLLGEEYGRENVEDTWYNQKKVKKILSDFLGRDIDVSILNAKEKTLYETN